MSTKKTPSLDQWLNEAKADPKATDCGMFLFHNGVVRRTARSQVREGNENAPAVIGMNFSYDAQKVEEAVQRALAMPGIFLARVWLNEGRLVTGDDIMLVLVGGDIRPHVVDALQELVGELKNNCVTEQELWD